MTQLNTKPSTARPSVMASGLYWISAGIPSIFCMIAFLVSWPLGPGFVDEGGVTKLRLAVALLTAAILLGINFLVILLLLIIQRLNDTSPRLSEGIEKQELP